MGMCLEFELNFTIYVGGKIVELFFSHINSTLAEQALFVHVTVHVGQLNYFSPHAQ